MTRDPNEVVAIVREKTDKDPAFLASVTAAYNILCDQIEARAKAKRPMPKVFEVRHECATARLALLSAIADGKDFSAARAIAAQSVGFEV
jgi:hypothetical protein